MKLVKMIINNSNFPHRFGVLNLTDDDKATLEGILSQSTVEARIYIRTKILLLKSECRSNEAIADKPDICVRL